MLKIQTPGPEAATMKVTFTLPVDEISGNVSVLGDFNGWDPLAHPLKKRSNGTRSVIVELPVAEYHFKYLADDGTWFCDPHMGDVESNEFHELNSVLRA